MKFLGIRNGHDANVTITDGRKVKYIKFERLFQKKHHKWSGEDPQVDDMPEIIRYLRESGFDPNAFDAICINPSTDRHMITLPEKHELAAKVNSKGTNPQDPFWEQFKCPVWVIDHHWAHALSCWPLVDYIPVHNFVFDGIGDYARHMSYISNWEEPRLVCFCDLGDDFLGLSVMLEAWAEQYGIQGMRVDLSGKIMALQAQHNLTDAVMAEFHERSSIYDYRHLGRLKEVVTHPSMAEHFRTTKQGIINCAYVLHEFGRRKIPQLMKLYTAFEPVGPTITYSGGTAQNTSINTSIIEAFPNVIIPPHCPDDGISLGCVEFLRQSYGQEPFDASGFPFWQQDETPASRPTKEVIKSTAEKLARGKIVGWYQGNGEIGPRALGNRSILMDPRIKDGQAILNGQVKKREPYRPFGASILEGYTRTYFDFGYPSPYMLFVCPVKTDHMPAVTHSDGTCRIQTVAQEPQFEDYYNLLEEFRKLTGCPCLLNTSLNVNGKPIAGHRADAVELYSNSGLDCLVVGDVVMDK